ncbi:hypothetical protein AWB98_29275 [Mycolicibacterium conceptionense]|uniref:Uncharacterized protein n=1 Tax=Mycolicibacterium conceptionense TaxID=451644 RepID=A0ABX3UXW7_9MYCO|nr:hypothetical protein AWB98_29275 [Mycolicibacterium conceptionense]
METVPAQSHTLNYRTITVPGYTCCTYCGWVHGYIQGDRMTDRTETVIAEQLANNLADRIFNGPRWVTHDELTKCLAEEARAILAAFKAARIAVVELPEPAMHSGAGDPVWQTLVGSEPEDVFFEGDEVLISGVCQLFADEVRPLAASLLAAELFAAEASQ